MEIRSTRRRRGCTRSLPTRGAWIEISPIVCTRPKCWVAPHTGAWIEMLLYVPNSAHLLGRSPHGERGLKFAQVRNGRPVVPSLPTRGAWIEISQRSPRHPSTLSLPTRGAWIEIAGVHRADEWRSLPTRGAWIEIANSTAWWTSRACRSPHGERGLKCDHE